MKTLKVLFLVIISIISQLGMASSWRQIEFKENQYYLRISYTLEYLPATYGSQGGMAAGLFYVDLHSVNSQVVESGEILGIRKDGREELITVLSFNKDTPHHSFAKKSKGHAYADYLWKGKYYRLKLYVDGQLLEKDFKLD